MKENEPKRIALVSNTLSSGGAEHVAANLSRFLSKEYQVDLIVNDRENIDYSFEGTIYDLDMPAGADRSAKSYQIKAFLRRTSLLRKLKRERKYKAVISFSDNTNLSNVLSGSAQGKTIVSVRFSLEGKEESGQGSSKLRKKILRTCCRKADKIVCCSKEIQRDLQYLHGVEPDKLITIYNGVEQIGSAHHTSSERKTILSLGRMTKQKGQQHLIRALKLLRDQGLDVQLKILGEGPLRHSLETLCQQLGVADYVQMPGRVADPTAFFEEADVCVIPSMYEGFSNVIMESLACGVPCIATDHKSGAREILAPDTDFQDKVKDAIEHAQYGVLVPVCYSEKEERLLASAINEILTDGELNHRYREAGIKRASMLTMEFVTEQWITLIEE